jgi:hypothetical protein
MCITLFEDLKRNKKSKYIIYKIGTPEDGENNGKIYPVKESTEQDYEKFVEVLSSLTELRNRNSMRVNLVMQFMISPIPWVREHVTRSVSLRSFPV